jgi:hypothetical protein
MQKLAEVLNATPKRPGRPPRGSSRCPQIAGKTIVELHGGSIEVNSDGEDKGCECGVRLPLTQPPAGV